MYRPFAVQAAALATPRVALVLSRHCCSNFSTDSCQELGVPGSDVLKAFAGYPEDQKVTGAESSVCVNTS